MWSIVLVFVVGGVVASEARRMEQEEPAVTRFRNYIKIDTSQDKNVEIAVEFWKAQALELGLPIEVHRPDGKPVVVITWRGQDPNMPSIILNSHMDVVTADENEWKYPPFSAYKDENGDIYGRGTQDTKDIAIQYLEAVRKLMADNFSPLRTVHMTLMPDEETGGYKGMKAFIKTEAFDALNIGFALDEGYSSKNETMLVFTQDKRPFQMEFRIYGEGGHGSTMPKINAAEKANRLISRVLEFRRKNFEIQETHDVYDFGKYTSVNVNAINGGSIVNIIPTNFTVKVDMRLSADSDVNEIYDMIQSWMNETGNDTEISFFRREDVSQKTELDESNQYWTAMKSALDDLNYHVVESVCPATTDIMNLRNLGIPSVGFAPKILTTSRIHGKDEYLNEEIFLNGIDIYYEIIKRIAKVPYFDANNYVA